MTKRNELIGEMIGWERGNAHRIQHFLKVNSFSEYIARQEGVTGELFEIISVASLCHDIGIKLALEEFSSSAGPYQEKLGPPAAKRILEKLAYKKELIERVSFLVGHHHTYDKIDGIDYQILVEADFLVNIFESKMDEEKKEKIKKNIFKTKTGLRVFEEMYG